MTYLDTFYCCAYSQRNSRIGENQFSDFNSFVDNDPKWLYFWTQTEKMNDKKLSKVCISQYQDV